MEYHNKIEVYAAMVALSEQMLAVVKTEQWEELIELMPMCELYVEQLQYYDNVLPLSSDTRALNLQSMLRIQANCDEVRAKILERMQTLNLLIHSCENEQKLASKYVG
jgi:Flagellar protein FliT